MTIYMFNVLTVFFVCLVLNKVSTNEVSTVLFLAKHKRYMNVGCHVRTVENFFRFLSKFIRIGSFKVRCR